MNEKVLIKDIKGLDFKCNTCGLNLSYILDTQQTFINECPNCGAEWLPAQLNIENVRNLKSIFKVLSKIAGADISLSFEKEK
ncbi:hypothetical protein CPIN18021_0343 [Campylobacter pinnipediorum subsp. caledonicus]|uniref:Uncharacterized protein n=1 Tax=Campylobacter pinnipediorum subsp. caledonicus TaxID=1874362 RepID=A0A1S6U678_9BACT|nr:hypothetical protein [Campylobacter pinnipediorum]AQW85583.1 hypothetical protein CPIN18020_0342 [Campylobacter pinnipediorum subsp. caledonicus]AQW87189.1 hypothetical protein CPIN18021_0343 [Campylobacter pinnipediorum subsp. caledonicus]OPA71863.1 hypothetical protein BB381_06930 [Campylobacter pinnipediorum subsp. caledonicus]